MNFSMFTTLMGLPPAKNSDAASRRLPMERRLDWGCDDHSRCWLQRWQQRLNTAAVPIRFFTVTSHVFCPQTTHRARSALRQLPNMMYLALSSRGFSLMGLQMKGQDHMSDNINHNRKWCVHAFSCCYNHSVIHIFIHSSLNDRTNPCIVSCFTSLEHMTSQSQESQHGGCWCTGPYLAPGNLQLSWWCRLFDTNQGVPMHCICSTDSFMGELT